MNRSFQLLIWIIFLGSGLSVIMIAKSWYGISQQNDQISELIAGHETGIETLYSAPPEVRLARTTYLLKQHRLEDALATLSAILDQGDERLQAKIRYNLGNLFLNQAITRVDAARADVF
jgi:mxaK protein